MLGITNIQKTKIYEKAYESIRKSQTTQFENRWNIWTDALQKNNWIANKCVENFSE